MFLCIRAELRELYVGINDFYGSPHSAFIDQVLRVTSQEGYLLRLLHGIRSVEIPKYPKAYFEP